MTELLQDKRAHVPPLWALWALHGCAGHGTNPSSHPGAKQPWTNINCEIWPGYRGRTLLESSNEWQTQPWLPGKHRFLRRCPRWLLESLLFCGLCEQATGQIQIRSGVVVDEERLHGWPPSVTLCVGGLKFNRKKKYKDTFYNIESLLNQTGQNHYKI